MTPVSIIEGDSPVILSAPHAGVEVPDILRKRLNTRGLELVDTDWHVDRVYEGLLDGATTIKANFHRYVIDANRAPSNESLYPGQNTTGLCPETDFDGKPIWRDGEAPGDDEIEARRAAYHAPYHAAIESAIERAKAKHGLAVLYDCHSIRSEISYLFDGELPALNLGTNSGASCSKALETLAANHCKDSGFSNVLNGRFKGGWTTRHYGRPADNIHAIQMELAQRTYMEEMPPWRYDEAKANSLRRFLKSMLSAIESSALKGEL